MMEMTPSDHEVRYVRYLSSVCRSSGVAATLRRGLGHDAWQIPAMYPYVVRWLGPHENPWRATCYFQVAALYGLHPLGWVTREVPEEPEEEDETAEGEPSTEGEPSVDGDLPAEGEPSAESEPGPEARGVVSNLGASLARLAAAGDRPSIERRTVALLQADRTHLAGGVTGIVRRLKNESIPVDWAQLLHDMTHWGYRARAAWATSFWGYTEEETEITNVR